MGIEKRKKKRPPSSYPSRLVKSFREDDSYLSFLKEGGETKEEKKTFVLIVFDAF